MELNSAFSESCLQLLKFFFPFDVAVWKESLLNANVEAVCQNNCSSVVLKCTGTHRLKFTE